MLLVVFVGLLSYWLLTTLIRRSKSPPGPFPLPILGNDLKFLGNIPDVCDQLNDQYGDLVQFQLNGEPVVLISDPSYLKDFYTRTNGNFRMANDEALKELGMYHQGLVMNNHADKWKTNRRIFVAGLSANFLRAIVPYTVSTVREMFVLFDKAQRKPVNVADIFGRMSMEIIGQLALGEKFNSIFQDDSPTLNVVKQFFKVWEYLLFTPYVVWKYLRPFQLAECRKTVAQLGEFELSVIAKQRKIFNEQLAQGVNIGQSAERVNFVTALLALSKSNQQAQEEKADKPNLRGYGVELEADLELSDSELQQMVREMVLGGTDTSSNVMSHIMFALAKNPQAREKLEKEIDEVLGDADAPSYDQLPLLKYTEAVIHETMRLHPVIPINIRRLEGADKIGKYSFAPKTNVLVNMSHIAHDPRYFNQPLSFMPERFLDGKIDKFLYALFGYGGKSCPGQHIAMLEIKTALAMLCKKYRFEFANPKQELVLEYNIVNHIKGWELLMKPIPRV
eukprot:TRINITY_DN12113_c0_g1_i1.p1 TRINITY_DN12113_c0_g1~~TRINITY_DN12113_c0_g1_i1.p1  ORF type:complete len:506 (+),score=210.40 TRINITY_DN12113_c0_g1_i1:63-1580(+)